MLRLGMAPNGWLQLLPGVKARFDPISRPMVRAARRATAAFLAANPDLDDDDRRLAAGDTFTAELVRQGLREWEGIGDPEGEPLEVSAAAIEMFIAEPLLFEAADTAWVMPWALQAAEKNASSLSPAGTTKAVMGAKTTAGSPAKPAKTTKAAGVAKSARTRSTRPERTPAKRSGK